MITMMAGLQGCFLPDTMIETIIGNQPIRHLFRFKGLKPHIHVLDDKGSLWTSDYKIWKTERKKIIMIRFHDIEFGCSSSHKWLVYDGIKIYEITADELIKNDKRPKKGKESYVEKTGYGTDKGIVSQSYEQRQNSKAHEYLEPYNRESAFNDEHPSKNHERTGSVLSKRRDMEKRKSWKEKSILQAWKVYWSKKESRDIYWYETVFRQDLRILRFTENKQKFRPGSSSHRRKQQEQYKRKSYDFMPGLSCENPYVYETSKKKVMYDISVPGYHNFILEKGFVTMNSGKTASCVREMMVDISGRTFFSNILTKKLKNNIMIRPDMIVTKTPVILPNGKVMIKNGEPAVKYSVNREFWEDAAKKYNGLNVIIDEAHSILNARRAMTRSTQPILDWIALLRRVLGSTASGYGRLFLVTQIERRLDIVAKEQATEVRYHLCHFTKSCTKCGCSFNENNEVPEQMSNCPRCSYALVKHRHYLEVWHFQDYNSFIMWKYLGKGKTYYKHYYITDIEKVFPFYNTMQWENLITEI